MGVSTGRHFSEPILSYMSVNIGRMSSVFASVCSHSFQSMVTLEIALGTFTMTIRPRLPVI